MKANWNTHTFRCGHASGTDEDYVKAAIRAGIEVLGFSDNAPFRESFPEERMDYSQLEDYRRSILGLKKKYKDEIEIHLGIEVDHYDNQVEDMIRYRKEMEYVILGQHQIEYKGMSSYQIFDENGLGYYIDHIEYACSHGLCDCIAHPDVFLWAYPKLDGSARQACARIAEIAAEYNVPLELNCGGIRFGKMEYSDGMRYPYPVRMFFHEAAKRKCIVIPGVDAHDPSDLENEAEMNQALSTVQGLKLNIIDGYNLIAEANRRKKQMRFL